MRFWLTVFVIAECLSRVNGCACEGKAIDDHCYEIHQTPTPGWISADETCQSTGGHLAIFLNESQTQHVIQYLETFLTIPVLTGIVVANAQTQRLAAICPNNSYYGLIPSDLSQELVDSNFTNTDRCTYLGPPDFKLTFADCNSTSVLCDRPMVKKDYCNSLATCDNGTTIGTTLSTATMGFEDTENSTDTQNSTTAKTTLVVTSMPSVTSMHGSSSTATPTTTSTVTTNSTANTTATTLLINSTKTTAKTTIVSNSTELSKTTVSFWDSITLEKFTNPFDFGNSTTENSITTTKPVITTTLLVVNGPTTTPINTTGVNGSSTTTLPMNSTINFTTTTNFNTTAKRTTIATTSGTTTVFVNNTTNTSTTSTTTTTTVTSSVTNSTLPGGTVNSTITTTAIATSGNTTKTTITILPTGSSTTTVYVYESCRSGGIEIWGWCIPWWLLALLSLLLLLLLCCAFMWCLCGSRKARRAEERAVVPKMNIGVQTAGQNSMESLGISPEPILVKEMERVRLPIDTDDKATMTDFDPDIRVEIEERIKEVEKVIYEPESNMQFPPQPISPKAPQPDPIDIPINIDIHTRHFQDIYRTEYVKEERHIVEVPEMSQKEIKADEELETLKVIDVTDTAVSPIPQPESTLSLLPLAIAEPHSPIEWKFNNKLPKDMGAFDSDIDEPIEENLSHRFVPTKRSHASTGKSKRKLRRERDLEIGEESRNIEQTPHRFTPKHQLNVLKTLEMPPMKRKEKPKFGPRPIFQQLEPDVLKIGTPMSRDSKSREDPQRVPRGVFDDISKRPTLSNRPFRDAMLGRAAQTRRSLDPPRKNRRQISPAGNMFSDISRSNTDLRFKDPDGRLGGVVGPKAKGWKPWAKQPKSFSEKPIFLDYD